MIRLSCPIFVFLALLSPRSQGATISLAKPLSENFKPDAIYWSFDTGKLDASEPNPVPDDSGNGFDGYLLAGTNGKWPVYVEGKFGAGIRLRGEDPHGMDPSVQWRAVESPGEDASRMDIVGKSFTVGAWVKFNEISTEDAKTFILCERGRIDRDKQAWNFFIYKSPEGDKWRLRMHIGFANTYKDVAGWPIDFSDGGWHHVALTYRQEEGSGVLVFWFDGVAVNEGIVVEAELPLPDEEETSRVFTVGEKVIAYNNSCADVSVDEVFVTSGAHEFEP